MQYKIVGILIISLSLPIVSHAQWDLGFDFNKAGTAGLQFLKIGTSARESAMGEAAMGVTKGADAIFWNPAGIAYVNKREVSFSNAGWLLSHARWENGVFRIFSTSTAASWK